MQRMNWVRAIAGGGSVALILAGLSLAKAADDSSTQAGAVTFTRDVAPILYSKCVSCHRPGEAAPMALRDYDEVRPWVKSIRKAVIEEHVMPPWHAVAGISPFVNDRSLSQKEIATIDKWIASGTPKGDPADMPTLPKFAEGWRLGEPDLIVTFPENELEAGGPDVFKDIAAEVNLTEDRWVRAIEVRPGNRKVVHHVIAFLKDPSSKSGGSQGWLGAWAAGMEPMVFPEGTGRYLKKGIKVVADMHYHPTDVAAKDQTKIGLYFAPKELGKEVINLWIANGEFMIPAGAENHEVRSTYTFDQDCHILSLLPHMHYRGNNFTYTATYPDGRKEVLLKVEKYDFNWQTVYYPEKRIAAPRGTRIDCVAHYDNSKNNPKNPDPNKDVKFGNQSFDEMMIGFVDYIVDEGVRPPTADQRVAEKLVALLAEHPGEVYKVDARDEGVVLPTVLHLPSKGEGTWVIPINGVAVTSTVSDVTRLGPAFSAKVKVPGQGVVTARGTLDAAKGTIKGKIYLMEKALLDFDGAVAK